MADKLTFRTDATLHLWGLLFLAFVALAVGALGFSDHLPHLPAAVAAALSGVWAVLLLIGWVTRRAVLYTVSADRLEVERGVLGRRFESVELWRVRDVVLDQGLLQRLRSVGRVTVYSTDRVEPIVEIGPVANAHELYDQLRDRVSAARKSARVVPIDGGA